MTEERKIVFPAAVASLYDAVTKLNAEFPNRSFTPDGHLVGHLGEVIAAQEFGLTLLANSHPGHDARDAENRLVQIKLTASNHISMYADCDRLIVMRIECPQFARLVYDGPGGPIWSMAGKVQKNGQRRVSLSAIRRYTREENP